MLFGKLCISCGKKINKKYSYCPYCGISQREHLRINVPFSAIIDQVESYFQELDKAFASDFSQELRKEVKKNKLKGGGISISINSSGGEPEIRLRTFNFGDKAKEREIKERKIRERIQETKLRERELLNQVPSFSAEELSQLPREEPISRIRRLSDKIIYEIEMPQVTDLKNVFVARLQNSIEIKAFAKDKAYFKLIPLNLEVQKYYLKDEKLILELKE
ncbi:MAG: hypothetical protein AABX59_03380 [Nanoarchaeota archaeon]